MIKNRILISTIFLLISLAIFSARDNSLHNPNENITLDETMPVNDENFDDTNVKTLKQDDEKVNNLSPDIFNHLYGAYRLRTSLELEQIVRMIDFPIVVFIYKQDSIKSREVAQSLVKIMEDLENIVALAIIDCDTFTPKDSQICNTSELSNEEYPKLYMLGTSPSRVDKSTSKLDVHHEIPMSGEELTEENIYNFIVNNVHDLSLKLEFKHLNEFLNDDVLNKVIYFSDNDNLSLMMKGVISFFYDNVLFANVNINKEPEIAKYFNVTKTPALIVYKTKDNQRLVEEPETIVFNNKFNYESIKEFIQPFSLQEKVYQTLARGIPLEDNIATLEKRIDIKELKKKEILDYLEKYKERNILLYLESGSFVKQPAKRLMIEAK